MDKIKELFKKVWEKFKSFSKGLRIAICIAIIAFIIAIITFFVYSAKSKYQVLFSDLDPQDAQVITNALEQKKVEMKVEGNSILVDKNKVDELRLELAPQITGGSKGYELMDNSSSFGMTDEEFALKKQRMLQGELEKTIKSFPQVKNVRVHITPAKDSVFVEDKQPGKAVVILDLLPGNTMTPEQVKSIVALVSGSCENIPQKNVQVIDQNMTLLSAQLDLGDNNNGTGVTGGSIANQQKLETDYEGKLQKQIVELLEPVIGQGKVKANVNVDMDFDSKQKTETVIDPNKVIVSQETIKDINKAKDGAVSESPVDNNMSNTIDDSNGSSSSQREEQKTNYDTGKTETKVISAPGEVKRMTASVIIDGDLQGGLQQTVQQAVESAIGFNTERGDQLSVVGLKFDPTAKAEQQKQLDEFNQQIQTEKRNKIIMYSAIGAAVLIGIIVLIIILRKKKQDEEDRELDVMIGGDDYKDEVQMFKNMNLDTTTEQEHMENQIKDYAKEKPEQVADIVKSWLKENER